MKIEMWAKWAIVQMSVSIMAAGCSSDRHAEQSSDSERLPAVSIVDRIMDHAAGGNSSRDPRAETKERILAEVSNLPAGPIDVTFLVRRDETVALYSDWSGKSADEIARMNGLVSGESLKIATPITLKLTADELDGFESARRRYHEAYEEEFFRSHRVVELVDHPIVKGDNLWKLSRSKSGTIPYWLMDKVNPDVDFSKMVIGDVIKIPVLAAHDAQAEPDTELWDETGTNDTPTPVVLSENAGLTLQVRSGETLSTFARCGKLSAARIAEVNGLAVDALLNPGQELVVPVADHQVSSFYACRKSPEQKTGDSSRQSAARGSEPLRIKRQHTVASGESAWIIAKKANKISLKELQQANPGVNLEKLSIGQKLNIP
ncbi:MAG: LysM peptidoglycan-binding domain-containing protein [Myxococcales bacterium]|nr:LysM peptidoglycan-binding domain-containing protein [Myxococcales bacterium]